MAGTGITAAGYILADIRLAGVGGTIDQAIADARDDREGLFATAAELDAWLAPLAVLAATEALMQAVRRDGETPIRVLHGIACTEAEFEAAR
jgi:hypothetical protein